MSYTDIGQQQNVPARLTLVQSHGLPQKILKYRDRFTKYYLSNIAVIFN